MTLARVSCGIAGSSYCVSCVTRLEAELVCLEISGDCDIKGENGTDEQKGKNGGGEKKELKFSRLPSPAYLPKI